MVEQVVEKEVLKNGLTLEQSSKAREILREATIKKVADKIGVSHTKIHNILRGTSPDIELLGKAILTAKEIISNRQKILKNLPV